MRYVARYGSLGTHSYVRDLPPRSPLRQRDDVARGRPQRRPERRQGLAIPRDVVGGGKENDGESTLIGRGYLVRQAATLLKFAQTTTDPKVAAGLVEKAADLRSQVDEASALPDLSSRAPDVDPPAAT